MQFLGNQEWCHVLVTLNILSVLIWLFSRNITVPWLLRENILYHVSDMTKQLTTSNGG